MFVRFNLGLLFFAIVVGSVGAEELPPCSSTSGPGSGACVVLTPPAVPTATRSLCRNQCGDGECQEMVCMAEGCPCAESQASCPADCLQAEH